MEIPLLIDIVIILGLSILVTFVCTRLKIPVIVGFLITGTIAGPYGFSLVKAVHEVEIIAEIGVILLLFSIGLEFSLKHLLQLRKTVLLGGTTQVVLTFAITYGIGIAFGLPESHAVFAGFLTALSSTAIVLNQLQGSGQIEVPFGRTSLGILIFQDIIIVPMMIFTPFLADSGSLDLNSILLLVAKVVALIIFILLGTKYIIPKIFFQIARTRNQEIFLLSVVFIAFAIAWLTSQIGLSLALGAFLAGLMIAESEYSHSAISHILPFRDIFLSFFFVSIGMLLNIQTVLHSYLLILLFFVLVLIIKFFTATIATLLLKYPLQTAVLVGLSLAQIGEFSFILARTGRSYQLIGDKAYQLFLAVSVLTMMATPFMIRLGKYADVIVKYLPLPSGLKQRRFDSGVKPPELIGHLVVVGFGVNGKNLAHAARVAEIPYIIVDLNPETVQRERKKGEKIYFGDAGNQKVLEELHADRAAVLAIAGPDITRTRRIVFLAKLLNPDLHVIARTRFISEIEPLKELGADEVIAEEFESAIEIFTRVLNKFNISSAQIQALSGEVRAGDYRELRTEQWESSQLGDLALPSVIIQPVTMPVDSALIGKNLRAVAGTDSSKLSVIALSRGGRFLSKPDGSEKINADDILVLGGKPEAISAFIIQHGLNETQS